ncbi:MAG: alkaline phosphatase family protein [Solirubrobacteraceae bacterium]
MQPLPLPQGLRAAAGLALTALLLAACGTSARRAGPVQTVAAPTLHLRGGAPAHIAVIVMENEEYGDIIGSGHATPFIDTLAHRYALAQQMYATTHPSLPNYMALTGGSTFGIDSDCGDCRVSARGLPGQLAAAHVSWRAYMEDLPRACFTDDSAGGYAIKHDPFLHYDDVLHDPAQCARVVPLTRLSTDERDGTLPRFVWITPNLCYDMHDCDPTVGDAFLARTIPPLLESLGPRGVLLLTWDEGTTDDGCCRLAAGGHIAAIVAGPGARAHARMRTPADQYSILQAIEDLLGLDRLRGAACACTPTLAPLFRSR